MAMNRILCLTLALIGLSVGQYHGGYPEPFFGQNHAMVVDHSAGTGSTVNLQQPAPPRTLIRIPPNTPVYREPPARPPVQLQQSSHQRVPVHVAPEHGYPHGQLQTFQQQLSPVRYSQHRPVQQQLSPIRYAQHVPQAQSYEQHVPQVQSYPQHAPHDQGYAQELPQVSVQKHIPQAYESQISQPIQEVKEQKPIKKGPGYHVIMYEKREFVDPPKGHHGNGKEEAKRYYSYGYGIGYGQHAPGQEYERGYGYVRAHGKALCKEPPCNEKFEFIGNREPYGYRN